MSERRTPKSGFLECDSEFERESNFQDFNSTARIMGVRRSLMLFIIMIAAVLLLLISFKKDSLLWNEDHPCNSAIHHHKHQRIASSKSHLVPWFYEYLHRTLKDNAYPSSVASLTDTAENDGSVNDDKCTIPVFKRQDCFPEGGASQETCEAKGCCWVPLSVRSSLSDRPWCFYPTDNSGNYEVHNLTTTSLGWRAFLVRQNSTRWPNDVNFLQLDIKMETESRLHFKIYDPNNARFEPPINTPQVSSKTSNPQYKVEVADDLFSIRVSRVMGSTVLFDTNGTKLIFADQYIQINTLLPTKYLYGFGEHRGRLLHDASQGFNLATWARDIPPAGCVGCNLYGQHPLFIGLEQNGDAYGVFLLNNNAMQYDVTPGQPPVLTYTTIGGILDFYIFTGPSPGAVVQQYLDVIGLPYMPPYWGLGFHLCRWGYNNSTALKAVIQRMRAGGFPYDTQWSDIDYMSQRYDWTYDTQAYPDLPAIVDDLHAHGQHYMMIVDPGIRNKTGYVVYDEGIRDGVFILKADKDEPLIGRVWPGMTAFPDFFNPATQQWWERQAKQYHDQVAFDGLWTDMNEPSSFVVGSVDGCTNSSLDNPPFVPGILGGTLEEKTLCPSGRHKSGTHYDLHSMYGLSEQIASQQALHAIRPGVRTVVISRSTAPSSGKYGGHWTGDNAATWDDIAYSIPAILNFQFFGIPFVGADICGFMDSTSGELCVRWTQLGVFYPFMRNHNSFGEEDQDPASDNFSEEERQYMKDALLMRYTLLPHLYTLLYRAHTTGITVARPLWFEYSNDTNTFANDAQFMWGESLMVAPVITEGATTLSAYFPSDTWVGLMTAEVIQSSGETKVVNAPLDKIPVYQRAGSVIPMQHPNVTTTLSRKQPFGLMIALDAQGLACGSLYWDDGETLDADLAGLYNDIKFAITTKGTLVTTVAKAGYTDEPMTLDTVFIKNAVDPITTATVNGASVKVIMSQLDGVQYTLTDFTADLLKPIEVQWN